MSVKEMKFVLVPLPDDKTKCRITLEADVEVGDVFREQVSFAEAIFGVKLGK
jgi:hypothetical protein